MKAASKQTVAYAFTFSSQEQVAKEFQQIFEVDNTGRLMKSY